MNVRWNPTESKKNVFRVALSTGVVEQWDAIKGTSSVTKSDFQEALALDYSPDGSARRLQFEIADFIQVNGFISQRVVNQAIDWLAPQPGERVLELFCGLGNFSLPLAARGVALTAVEGDAGLVQRARDNAQRNQMNIRFERPTCSRPAPRPTGWRVRSMPCCSIHPAAAPRR